MSRKSLATIAVVAALLVLSCGAARAQEQQPSQEPTQVPPGSETTQPGGEAAPPGHVYFYLDGELAQVERDITGGGQMVEFAILELLKGPTEEEKAAGYVTYIPEGTKLMYTTIKQDRSEFSLNLSRELLGLAGDEESSVKAMKQIAKTVQDVSGIQSVGITVAADAMGGQPEDAYEALGVSRSEITGTSGGEEAQTGESKTGLVLGIVFGCLGALALIAVIALAARKRRDTKDRGGKKKAGGSKPASRTGRKKGK
ncbi:MAG: GerMN domain-containing protein [Actinobacteria bacterium]|nr:GerMN domain-containing protein [Actinomycetota bacterium]